MTSIFIIIAIILSTTMIIAISETIGILGKIMAQEYLSSISTTLMILQIILAIVSSSIIYNIFNIAILGEIKDYGILRAIGASNEQIYWIGLNRIAKLIGISLPIGVINGIYFSKFFTTYLTNTLSLHLFNATTQQELHQLIDKNSTINIVYILYGILLVIGFSLLAVLPSIKYVTKVSALTAISGTKLIKINRKDRTTSLNSSSMERQLAKLNLERNKSKTMLVILAMSINLFVFIVLSVDLRNFQHAIVRRDNNYTDFSIYNVGTEKHILDKVAEQDSVKDVAYYSLTNIPSEKLNRTDIMTDFKLTGSFENSPLNIVGANTPYVKYFYPSLTSEQIEKFESGTGCIVANTSLIAFAHEYDGHTYNIGDFINVNDKQLEVLYFGAGSVSGSEDTTVQLYINENVYSNLGLENNIPAAYINSVNDSNTNEVWQELLNLQELYPELQVINYKEVTKNEIDVLNQTIMFYIGVIIFITILSSLNVFNTIYTNIYSKLKELGVQRAIGFDYFMIRKTCIFESIYCCIIASMIGLLASYITSIMLNYFASMPNIFIIPILPIILFFIVSLGIGVFSTLASLRQIKHLSIVETIAQ